MSAESSQINALGLMFDDCPSDDTLTLVLDDAIVSVKLDGVSDTDDNINLFRRLFAAHLLFLRGIVKITKSDSIGDVSASYQDIKTERDNDSPFLAQYRSLRAQDTMILNP